MMFFTHFDTMRISLQAMIFSFMDFMGSKFSMLVVIVDMYVIMGDIFYIVIGANA